MFNLKNKEVVLSNSTILIFRTVSEILKYLSCETAFEILHMTIRMKEKGIDPHIARQACIELKVMYQNITIDFEINMLIVKGNQSWCLVPNSEIIISHKENEAFGLIVSRGFSTSSFLCENAIAELRSIID